MNTLKESAPISDELTAELESGINDGHHLDTRVVIDGEFWIDGGSREAFCKKLGELINEYRI